MPDFNVQTRILEMAFEILVTSSILIVVLTVLRFVLRGKIRPKVQYAMWLLVALRLLMPVTLTTSRTSVMNYVPEVTFRETLPATRGDSASDVSADGTEVSETPAAAAEAARRVPTTQILLTVWAAGTGAAALWMLAQNLAFTVRLRRVRRRVDGTDAAIPVYVADALPSPCLFGLWHPAVYLTPEALDADGTPNRYILLHELTHEQRGDRNWALVRMVCIAVYWFDPLVWLAAALSRRDCELACDEAVLSLLGDEARGEYGMTLLDLISGRRTRGNLLFCATTMTSGKRTLRERFSMIARRPRTAVWAAVLALALCTAAAACTLTGKVQKPFNADLPAMFMLDGELHYPTGAYLSWDEINNVILAGKLDSCVSGSEHPSKDGQANWEISDNYYGYLDGHLVLRQNTGRWRYCDRYDPAEAEGEPWAISHLPHMLRLNGTLYYYCMDEPLTDDQITRLTQKGVIRSVVESTAEPAENEEANFACTGQPYGEVDGRIALFSENYGWCFCISAADREQKALDEERMESERRERVHQAVCRKMSEAVWDESLSRDVIDTFLAEDARVNGMAGDDPYYFEAFAAYLERGDEPAADEKWTLTIRDTAWPLEKWNLVLTIAGSGEQYEIYYSIAYPYPAIPAKD